MEFQNDKKIESSIRYLYYFISAIVCFFLILLAGRILDDLGSSVTYPKAEDYHNRSLVDSIENSKKVISQQLEVYNNKLLQIEKSSQLAKENYEGQKTSFDNWLSARKTIGEPKQDKEVLTRANEMDNYFSIQQKWKQQLSLLKDTVDNLQNKLNLLDNDLNKERNQSQITFDKAVSKYELHVFLIRLLFILPILALGIYFYLKKRNDKYSPIFLGFTFFALYAFFVQLVPYLPSYGGYLRYTVGILLSIAGGYYTINNIKSYLERRRAMLQESSAERMKKVQSNTETAFKAYEQHLCPSCGKDFIYKGWNKLSIGKESESGLMISNYCRQCGLQLYKKCEQCGEYHFAHLPFCGNCGNGNKE